MFKDERYRKIKKQAYGIRALLLLCQSDVHERLIIIFQYYSFFNHSFQVFYRRNDTKNLNTKDVEVNAFLTSMSSNAGIYFKDNLRPINAKKQKSFKDACTNKYLLYLTVFFQIINAILGMDIALYIFVFAHFTSSLRSFRKVLQIKESIWCITD